MIKKEDFRKGQKMNLLQKYINTGALTGGEPLDRLIASGGDPNVLRPFVGKDGKSSISPFRTDSYITEEFSG